MRPLSTLRNWKFDQLRRGVGILQFLIRNARFAALSTRKERPGGWTASEVIGHLLDWERLFLERAHLVMEVDTPDLPFPPQDDEVKAGRYNERNPYEVLQEWRQQREAYLDYLAAVPDES